MADPLQVTIKDGSLTVDLGPTRPAEKITITVDNLDADLLSDEWALCLRVAGAIFCEPALRQATMDAGAAFAIAAVVYKIRKEQGLAQK
jgi:hypothetical protein